MISPLTHWQNFYIIIGAAAALPAHAALALYSIGAVMVVLLFLGIRNAWDLVTYLAIERAHPENYSQG